MAACLFRNCSSSQQLGLSRSFAFTRRQTPPSCFGPSCRTSAPLLPQGEDPRERHHTGPAKYIGKLPADIVRLFKVEARFPWFRVDEKLRRRRFEELWQLAHKVKHKRALVAVQILTDPSFDRTMASAVRHAG
uniref:Uncharacterized protein n=1 Tax=Noctiluca scintillans TaxID=2966 RepID=A0A7S1AR08_NOCSC